MISIAAVANQACRLGFSSAQGSQEFFGLDAARAIERGVLVTEAAAVTSNLPLKEGTLSSSNYVDSDTCCRNDIDDQERNSHLVSF